MGQRKGNITGLAQEGVVVLILPLVALSSEFRMAHDRFHLTRDPNLELVSRQRPLIDLENPSGTVGNSGSVSSPGLACSGQRAKDLLFLVV